MLSKNKIFLRHFHNQLKENQVTKKYEAILFGALQKNIKIETKIDISSKEFLHKVQESKEGKKAISNFKLIKKYKSFTHAEIIISTGRMHQIRIQSANIGHPIINDKKYGLFNLNKEISKKTSISRLALHASSIVFSRLNGTSVAYKAPKNNDFDILLSQLSKLTVKS